MTEDELTKLYNEARVYENIYPKYILASPKVKERWDEWKKWWNSLPLYKKLWLRLIEKIDFLNNNID